MSSKSLSSAPFEGARYFNRELSWLEFEQRVLDEALNPSVPLLERVKFFAITFSNLDEFFEVRVAGMKQEVEDGVTQPTPDGMTPDQSLKALTLRAHRLVDTAYRGWREMLQPALTEHRIHFRLPSELNSEARKWMDLHYREKVHPVLTPLAIDTSHPFPHLANKRLHLIVRLTASHTGETQQRRAIVQVPRALPHLLKLPEPISKEHEFIFLSDIVAAHLSDLFPGTRIEGSWLFRVTRNSELYIDEEETPDLLVAVEQELQNRRKGAAVRLEIAHDCPEEIRSELLEYLQLRSDECYLIDGPLHAGRLMAVLEGTFPAELRDTRFVPATAGSIGNSTDIFERVRQGDVLLHHPYETYATVVEFLEQAAADPKVLAIKQTLYRTGGDPRIIGALMEAVRNGKQVTAVVELKARFDEANNIRWARALEEAGVHVVYGLVGYKIHCKLALVVRAENETIRRYLHLGTGNYNPSTARLYTDISLLTCRPEFGEDATHLFNLLTGICQFQGTRRLLVAHFEMHGRLIELIARETDNVRKGLPSRIIAKMNALVDTQIIDALYVASQAGVEVDLIVRGICCLRPGIPGLSERIRVRSIVDRFLEHARIWYFENARRPEVFIASADWMPRNLFKRIEVAFPVEDGRLRDRIMEEILPIQLADTEKARLLLPDGTSAPPPATTGAPRRRSQSEFIQLASGSPATENARSTAVLRPALRKKAAPAH